MHNFCSTIVRHFVRQLKQHPVLGCDALFLKNTNVANTIAYNYDVPVLDKNKPRADRDLEEVSAEEKPW